MNNTLGDLKNGRMRLLTGYVKMCQDEQQNR